MAKPSNKKVTRAARTSGGRTARGARPWGWYTAMGLVLALGVAGIVTSRNERIDEASGPQIEPTTDQHWHVAYGIYVCDKFLPPIQSDRDPLGIHTHNDGIIHIHPFQRAASGNNATLKIFAETVGLKVNATSFKVPGDKTYRDGQECDGKDSEVQFFVNGTRRTGNPASYKYTDRAEIVLAFAPKDHDVPMRPPSAPNLDNLDDVPGAQPPPPPGSTTESTTVPGETPTTAPGTATTAAPTATTAPGATPTTAAP